MMLNSIFAFRQGEKRALPLAKTIANVASNTMIMGSQIPKDLLNLIFCLLATEALYSARQVCRLWYIIASNQLTLPRLFPEVRVVDQLVWDAHVDLEKHGMIFEEIQQPRLYYKSDCMELRRMAAEVEGDGGISFLVLPKGLTLKKIIAIAGAPKTGNSIKFRLIWDSIVAKYGDKEIEKTVIVAITNGVFKHSNNIGGDGPEELIKGLKCDVPELVAVLALVILRYISSDPKSPLRLFDILTLCAEDIRGTRLAVGFTPVGPRTSVSGFDYECYGVGGQWKFEGDRY